MSAPWFALVGLGLILTWVWLVRRTPTVAPSPEPRNTPPLDPDPVSPGVKPSQTQIEDPPDGGTLQQDPTDPTNPFPDRRD